MPSRSKIYLIHWALSIGHLMSFDTTPGIQYFLDVNSYYSCSFQQISLELYSAAGRLASAIRSTGSRVLQGVLFNLKTKEKSIVIKVKDHRPHSKSNFVIFLSGDIGRINKTVLVHRTFLAVTVFLFTVTEKRDHFQFRLSKHGCDETQFM